MPYGCAFIHNFIRRRQFKSGNSLQLIGNHISIMNRGNIIETTVWALCSLYFTPSDVCTTVDFATAVLMNGAYVDDTRKVSNIILFQACFMIKDEESNRKLYLFCHVLNNTYWLP